MSGIWERIMPAATDRLPVHLLESCLRANAGGFMSESQIIAALDAKVSNPLAGAELTDISNILGVLNNPIVILLDRVVRLEYLERAGYALLAAEAGAITEAKFRSDLGIP